jgi:hypothetical protein
MSLQEAETVSFGLYGEARALLSDVVVRPSPHDMASLVLRGLTDAHLEGAWRGLGNEVPEMALTLEELDSTLPYVHSLNDTLAEQASDAVLHVHAGRDVEVMYDDFTIVHGGIKRSVLLPASKPLWACRDIVIGNDVAREFLQEHEITEDQAFDPGGGIALVDTGFDGRIGKYLGAAIRRIYRGGELSGSDLRLATKLVHANPTGWGESIAEVPSFDIATTVPKLCAFWNERPLSGCPSLPLAISLQMQPRYHGTYRGLARRDGTVIAVPDSSERIVPTVDRPAPGHEWGGVNDSIVNPLAAAVVQRRVVEAALLRNGNYCKNS